jgi:hypothetical protein
MFFGGLIFLICVTMESITKRVLSISPEKVTKRLDFPLGKYHVKSLPADEIEDVWVKRDPLEEEYDGSIYVISDEKSIRYGGTLGDEEKRWVRDCIIAVVGGAFRDEGGGTIQSGAEQEGGELIDG